ncbi:MAG: ATP-binding cassette domain-containing protein [Bacteroidota bacterium]|nr:ATP-binding cassette domain-containing protein [Bacteroidota bacterium]
MDSENIIDLNNISVYQNKVLVLKEVSLKINRNEFVYLIGKTGTGKSSLLKVLYADLPLKEGEATIVGFDLKRIKNKNIPFLRRKLGIVFQDFQLLTDRSVNDNLTFVMKSTGWSDKKKINERLEAILEDVGLKNKGYKMPHQLSGGEQQRVAIARAMINHPEVILADEPTGNLDPETSEGIMELLFNISKSGSVVLMATHDYSLFSKYPARIIKCENGNVIEGNIENNE